MLFKKKSLQKSAIKPIQRKTAVVLFATVREGILAEQVLQKKGFVVRKIAPPPAYRKGCEISIEIELMERQNIEKILVEHGLYHQGIIPV